MSNVHRVSRCISMTPCTEFLQAWRAGAVHQGVTDKDSHLFSWLIYAPGPPTPPFVAFALRHCPFCGGTLYPWPKHMGIRQPPT